MQKIDIKIYESMSRVLRASGQLEQITQSFCSNSQTRVSSLKIAVMERRTAEIISLAHAMKGSCSMFGARACAEICQKIETCCHQEARDETFEQISELVESLDKELAAVKEFLLAQTKNERPECCP